jgi:hypothetical protein
MKCSYCNEDIRGIHNKDWVYYLRYRPFKIYENIEDGNKLDFGPKREQLCIKCLRDLQHDHKRDRYSYDEIIDSDIPKCGYE